LCLVEKSVVLFFYLTEGTAKHPEKQINRTVHTFASVKFILAFPEKLAVSLSRIILTGIFLKA